MTPRVLVTGSSGFIGSHLMPALAGTELLGLDIRLPARSPVGSSFVQCDILDFEQLRRVVEGFRPDLVVHLAARTDLAGPDIGAYAANIDGTRNMVEAIVAAGTVQRALFTSSQLVCRVGHVPTSDTDHCPPNLYGQSKAESEKIVRAMMPASIAWGLLRPTTIWGEGMSSHYQRFLGMVQRGRYFHIGNGPLFKSYGYVGNAVHEYMRFLTAERSLVDRKTFYIADYEPLSLRAWVDSLARQLGATPPSTIPAAAARAIGLVGDTINFAGMKSFPLNTFRVRNILTEYVFDMTPTRAVCGPLPFSMDEGVINTAKWYRDIQAAALVKPEAQATSMDGKTR